MSRRPSDFDRVTGFGVAVAESGPPVHPRTESATDRASGGFPSIRRARASSLLGELSSTSSPNASPFAFAGDSDAPSATFAVASSSIFSERPSLSFSDTPPGDDPMSSSMGMFVGVPESKRVERSWRPDHKGAFPVRAALAVARARAGQKRYRTAFEILPIPCLLSNHVGQVSRMNEAARRLFGFEGASPVYPTLDRLFDLPSPEQLARALERVDNEPIRLRLQVALALDSRQWIDVGGSAISETDILWTLSLDSSSDRDRDRERREGASRASLDKDELIERQRKRIEALERDSRTKNKFIAVLGHDLRAPLNAVLGWTQLMQRELLDAVGRERALATIERNARSQATLIEELLDVTRLNEGRMTLEITSCDVGLVVRRTMEAALPQATNKDIRLVTQQKPGVTVAGDRVRIEQIVNNLVSNALKFTPPGGTIEVNVSRDAKQARIEVRDTGMGIAADQLPHVFKWLHQGSDGLPTREGLGIGLFIVRRLVELHGGNVRAASEGLGCGATFTVFLPCSDPVHDSEPSGTMLPELGELDGLDVLVVEDESDAVELLSRVLANRGANVTSARDASSALAFALPNAPDVIVTDLGLPDMDGLELVRRIRAEHGGAVGIVALTGFSAKDCECTPSAGFDEWLTKPVDISRLVRAIQQAARSRRGRSA